MVDVSPVATPANLKRRRPIPLSVALAMGWVALMVFIGIFADVRPYSITQINLAARLSPPLGRPIGQNQVVARAGAARARTR